MIKSHVNRIVTSGAKELTIAFELPVIKFNPSKVSIKLIVIESNDTFIPRLPLYHLKGIFYIS